MIETSEAIQAQIEGFKSIGQVQTVNRLRLLNISPKLISAASAAVDDSPEYKEIETAIIEQIMTSYSVDEQTALDILNGKRPCPTADHA